MKSSGWAASKILAIAGTRQWAADRISLNAVSTTHVTLFVRERNTIVSLAAFDLDLERTDLP